MKYRVNLKWAGVMNVTLAAAKYGDGTLALQGFTDDGPETFSINLGGYGLTPPDGRSFYAKDYSEHEGTPDALVAAGIATKVSEVRVGTFGSPAWLMRLADGVLPSVKP